MLRRRSFYRPLRAALVVAVACAVVVGCNQGKQKRPMDAIKPLYENLPAKEVPPVFKDSILARCDLINTEPFLVSGYGVVVNLNNTGDSVAPNLVRQYIYDLMVKRKWGSSLTSVKLPTPEQALRDPRVAIVQVDGYLPPGVRKGQPFDVQVSALPESHTSSLAGGDLYETELRILGANPADPGGSVNVHARAEGSIFVNPAYALDPNASENPAARRSLRYGVVMGGARSLDDRPIGLRLRAPSMRLSRFIENRIDSRFQEIRPDVVAAAQDEGVINFFVPVAYQGDYEHFAGVVTHLYLNDAPEFSAAKAKELADEALKPDAPLMDISYAWEGLGKAALPVIIERGLMTHSNEDIAYAAARAAAFLGDHTAPQALVNMARKEGHKFQINAIQVLGALPPSPAINEVLRPLLNSPQTTVRLEAYKMLAAANDNAVFTTPLRAGFMLDVVRTETPPVIYATQRGLPRVAVIGNRTTLTLPVTFMALDGRLSISSDTNNRLVTIFYRPQIPPTGIHTKEQEAEAQPIKVLSNPDIAEIVARLGGEGFEEGQRRLHFNYGQIVAILNNLVAQQQVGAAVAGGGRVPASFILQELPHASDAVEGAPVIPDQGRPQTDEPGRVGLAR